MDAINDKIDSYVVGGKYGFEFIPMEGIAQSLGVSSVGLRFMFGILVGKFIYFISSNSFFFQVFDLRAFKCIAFKSLNFEYIFLFLTGL